VVRPAYIGVQTIDWYEDTSLFMDGLEGCTALVISSKNAVWMGHFWEGPSFSPEGEPVPWQTIDDAFVETIQKPMNNDRSGLIMKESFLRSWTPLNNPDVQAAFADASTQVMMMIPTQDFNDVDDGYRVTWDRMKSEVKKILPLLQDDTRWKEHRYDAKEAKVKHRGSTRDPAFSNGRLLWQYDADIDNRDEPAKRTYRYNLRAEREVLTELSWKEEGAGLALHNPFM
jgi:hypothetical protein